MCIGFAAVFAFSIAFIVEAARAGKVFVKEEPAEEEKVEEPVVEETPAEEPVEETPVEETPAEEPVVEETDRKSVV